MSIDLDPDPTNVSNGGIIAKDISESMKKREVEFFKNPTMVAAVYVDVFNMHLLSSDQKTIAKEAVVELSLSEESSAQAELDLPILPQQQVQIQTKTSDG